MPPAQSVVLDVATPSDAPLLSNLLELYIHELSGAFPTIELGADGRFGYPRLALYWSEPERRFAFLIKWGAAVLLWNHLPGQWTVRVSEANPGALSFWAAVIAEFTKGAATESTRPGNPNPWRVFAFESAP